MLGISLLFNISLSKFVFFITLCEKKKFGGGCSKKILLLSCELYLFTYSIFVLREKKENFNFILFFIQLFFGCFEW